jgi:hypothetical protein
LVYLSSNWGQCEFGGEIIGKFFNVF